MPPQGGWNASITEDDGFLSSTTYRLEVESCDVNCTLLSNSTFEVTNQAPIASMNIDGGINGEFIEGIPILFDASTSFDRDNDEMAYLWEIDNVELFAGDDGLAPFLDGLNILVSVLPLTPATTGIMNHQLFNQLAKGAYIINGGRGPQLVEADLLDAIGSGQIAGAALDVFAIEPLPADHAFWTHPKITIWPHVAAQTNPNTAAMQVAAAITAIMAGREPENRVDWARGY